jgi:tRNA pseudouridine55 synthase
LLLLDKPVGISSNQALQRARRLFGAAKAGHGGSLDPLASGMLPIFFGAATRLAGYLLDARKIYRVTARLGVSTSTGDAEGAVLLDRSDGSPVEFDRVLEALGGFRGEIEQVPPMYSALKRDGVPLYRLARAGQEVERAARRVVIEELRLESYEWPSLTLYVRCSKGTYVRTLVEDLAGALGTVGHVAELRRLGVEPFLGEPMHALPELEAAAEKGTEALDACLIAPDRALAGWATAALTESAAARLRHGQAVAADPAWAVGPTRVYGPDGAFIAIGNVTAEGTLAPERVFAR